MIGILRSDLYPGWVCHPLHSFFRCWSTRLSVVRRMPAYTCNLELILFSASANDDASWQNIDCWS